MIFHEVYMKFKLYCNILNREYLSRAKSRGYLCSLVLQTLNVDIQKLSEIKTVENICGVLPYVCMEKSVFNSSGLIYNLLLIFKQII